MNGQRELMSIKIIYMGLIFFFVCSSVFTACVIGIDKDPKITFYMHYVWFFFSIRVQDCILPRYRNGIRNGDDTARMCGFLFLW